MSELAVPALSKDDLSFDTIDEMSAISYYLNMFNQMTLLFLTIGMSIKCVKLKLEKTALHAFLCTIGFVFLIGEGIVVRNYYNPFTHGMSIESRTITHFLLQMSGGLLGIFGTVAKIIRKKKHFNTMHGKLGLAACIFCLVNFITGFLAVFSNDYRVYIAPSANLLIHNGLGVMTFLTALLSQLIGYDTGFFRRNVDHIKTYKYLTFIILIVTILVPFKKFVYKFYKLVIVNW